MAYVGVDWRTKTSHQLRGLAHHSMMDRKKETPSTAQTGGAHARELGSNVQESAAAYQAALLLMSLHDHRKAALLRMADSWGNLAKLKDRNLKE